MSIVYANWGSIFWWPSLRRSPRAPTIKAIRGTLAIKAVSTTKRASVLLAGGAVPLAGPSVPLTRGTCSPYGPLLIV